MHHLHRPHTEGFTHVDTIPVTEVVRRDRWIERERRIIPESPAYAAVSATHENNAGKLIAGGSRSRIDCRTQVAWLDRDRVEDISLKQSFAIGNGVDVATN